MKKEVARNSSLEMLRIICMIFIILHHYSVHGGYDEFTLDTLNGNVVIIQMLSMFGRVACSVFAIITGYFMIASDKSVYRKGLSLLLEMIFYSVMIYFILLITGNMTISLKSLLKAMFPMFWGNWYVLYYLIFSLFIPYLNYFLKYIDGKVYAKLLVLIMVVWSIIPTFTLKAWSFSNFDFFVVMYLIGAFIRLHADDLRYKNKWNLYVALISGGLILLSVPLMDFIGIITGIDKFVSSATYFKEYSCPLGIIFAVGLFLYFKNLSFHNTVINRIASSTLAIYLIHDGMAQEVIWEGIFPNIDYLNTPLLLPHIIIKCSCIFVGCLVIDQIRLLTVNKWQERWLDRKYSIWTDKCRSWGEKLTYAVQKKKN